MLAITGNTGPYLQMAYARVCSIFRKSVAEPGVVTIGEPAERDLALALLGFEPAVRTAAELAEPHRLADLTARTLHTGMFLLGIEAPEQI